MNIPLMEYYRELKNYTYDEISELSGVPIETVQKIFRGVTETVDYEIGQAIEAVLEPEDDPDGEKQQTVYPNLLKEVQATYHARKNDYTLKDYYALPDDRRVELIDGVFYDMAAPTTGHQAASAEIFTQIRDFIKRKKGNCKVYMAPMDVQLDCDDKTMVQPDILVVCDKDKIIRRYVMGAPDFVIEILSESTQRKDMYLKLQKYEMAGVREYWMIDIERRKVIVYFFERDYLPVIYGMKDKVPVGIYNGELQIDFARVEEELLDIGQ